MAADFEAEIRNSLRALNSQVTALNASVDKLQSKGRSAGREVGDAFRRAAPEAAKAKAAVDGFGGTVKKTGEALTKMGGPLGELLGRLTGGAGLAGGLGRVAAAAAVFGLAMRAGNAVIEAQIDRTQKLIDAQKELRDVRASARAAEQQQALGAAGGQGNDLRQLFVRGNVEAIDTANRLAASGIGDASSIRKGVAQAYTLTGMNEKETAIAAAQRIANMGDMPFDQAIGALVGDRASLKSMMRPGGFKAGLERFILKQRGLSPTAANRAKIGDELTFSETSANESEGLIAELNKTQGSLNQIEKVGQDRVFLGQSSTAAAGQLAAARSPESAAMLELFNRQQQADADMRALIRAQGPIMAGIKDALMLIGGQGSFETQHRRQQDARAGATFGPE